MKGVVVVLAAGLALSACAGLGEVFKPQIVASNSRSVTIHDAIGLSQQSNQIAENYCRQFGRVSQYVGKGGPSWMCSGKDAGLRTTYNCVN